MSARLAAVLVAALTACATEPAHADAFLPDAATSPGQRPPATGAYFPLAGNHYDFDPGRGPLDSPAIEDAIWLNGWGTWGQGAAAIPLPTDSAAVKPCVAVPGPLPIAGVAAAWGWARRLRRRVG